ncbi:Vicilin-like seed storage protein, partial [Zea mays]
PRSASRRYCRAYRALRSWRRRPRRRGSDGRRKGEGKGKDRENVRRKRRGGNGRRRKRRKSGRGNGRKRRGRKEREEEGGDKPPYRLSKKLKKRYHARAGVFSRSG